MTQKWSVLRDQLSRRRYLKTVYQAWLADRPFLDWIEYVETKEIGYGYYSYTGPTHRVSSA